MAARLHGTKTRAVGPPSIRGQDAMVQLNECCRTNSKSKRNEETDGAALKAPRRNGAKIEQCQTGRRVGTISSQQSHRAQTIQLRPRKAQPRAETLRQPRPWQQPPALLTSNPGGAEDPPDMERRSNTKKRTKSRSGKTKVQATLATKTKRGLTKGLGRQDQMFKS